MRTAPVFDVHKIVPLARNAYRVDDLPSGTTREVIDVTASDGAFSHGILHRPPVPCGRAVAMFMHPRTLQTRPYLSPALLRAGVAVWGQASRHVNNDIDTTHEDVLLDVAAGMRLLRDRGFDTVVLIGNSGGGSLLGAYQWQATTPPDDREARSPAGEPTGFADEEMPAADLFVALAAHPGEGHVLLQALDAAIVDEADPTVVDPALDLYAAHNGYRPFPEPSRYAPEWVAAYRAAQRARCARLDDLARDAIAVRDEARATADPTDLGSPAARRALTTTYMVIHGTLANPAYLDPTITPNARPMGSVFADPGHPLPASLGTGGIGRVLTPRAWLSTWSGLSSRSMLRDAIEHLHLPTLVVYPEGDTEIVPADQDDLLRRSPAADLTYRTIADAGHYLGRSPGAPAGPDPREVAGRIVCDWLDTRLS